MVDVEREFAAYRMEFESLVARWNALPLEDRQGNWARYTAMLDEGEAGYHGFARLLVNAWCEGWDAAEGFAFDAAGSLAPARWAAAA